MPQNFNGTFPLQDIFRSTLQMEWGEYIIHPHQWRQTSDLTVLPSAGDGTDLGVVAGTHGSASPSLQGSDAGGTTVTEKARTAVQLPPEYVQGDLVQFLFHAGMLTTVADDVATLDVECFKSNDKAGIGSELYTGAAVDINSLTLADKTFVIDPGTLTPGSWLDVEITVVVTDVGNLGVMQAIIGKSALRCRIRG